MPNYDYNLNKIKEELTTEQIEELMTEWGGEPMNQRGCLICKTICHHSIDELDEAGHKLYYYENTHLFKCYSSCASSFDIFELTRKILERDSGNEVDLPHAVAYIAERFDYSKQIYLSDNRIEDWDILNAYQKINENNNYEEQQNIVLKEYDGKFLENLPQPRILNWEKEGINYNIVKDAGIKFDPISQSVIIPHYDINDRLIGIRARSFIKENADKYGKYRPAYIHGKLYSHPLSFNLYNLNKSKEMIKKAKKAVIFESEKSCLQLKSYIGTNNDWSVAVCGSSLLPFHFYLLKELGIEEIIIAFDRQFQILHDDECNKLMNKLTSIYKKYGCYCKISFIFDKDMITSYKASPIDEGIEKFITLYNNRVTLY